MENKLDKYMMATKAIHQLGDISRDKADLCCIHAEDENNYIGNWVTGYGFIDVKFPKSTTRDLTQEEIDRYHGRIFSINGNLLGALNLKNENFNRPVRVSKKDTDIVYTGNLVAPINLGGQIAMVRDNGKTVTTSRITNITEDTVENNTVDVVKTVNSVYIVEYL